MNLIMYHSFSCTSPFYHFKFMHLCISKTQMKRKSKRIKILVASWLLIVLQLQVNMLPPHNEIRSTWYHILHNQDLHLILATNVWLIKDCSSNAIQSNSTNLSPKNSLKMSKKQESCTIFKFQIENPFAEELRCIFGIVENK